MKNLMTLSMAIIAASLLTGCAYKQSGAGLTKIGYEEKKLDDGSYKLTFYGSGFSKHDELIKLWHRRAEELCKSKKYDAETKNSHWTSDSYVVLFPIFLKSETGAPSIEGRLKCKNEELKNASQSQN